MRVGMPAVPTFELIPHAAINSLHTLLVLHDIPQVSSALPS